MFINGERVDAASGATTEVHNPATGEVVDSVPKADAADTRRAIDAAAAAFAGWSKMSATKRSHIMNQADANVRAEFWPRSTFSLSASVQYEAWSFPVIESTKQSNVTTSIQLSFWPRSLRPRGAAVQ